MAKSKVAPSGNATPLIISSKEVQSIIRISLKKVSDSMDMDELEFFTQNLADYQSFYACIQNEDASSASALFRVAQAKHKQLCSLSPLEEMKERATYAATSQIENSVLEMYEELLKENSPTLTIHPSTLTTNHTFASTQSVPGLSSCKYRRTESLVKDLPPIMIWGPPGVGKSAIVKGLAKELGIELVDVRLAQKDPTDMKGLPVPNKETLQVEWYLSSEWPRTKASRGIIFFDELTAAEKAIQVAAYELILDRKLGDVGPGKAGYKVPPGWFICAAGNQKEDQAVSEGMSSALANRFLHLTIKADAQAWLAWARKVKVHPSVIDFIDDYPVAIHNMDESVVSLEKGWPSPRAWERVSNLLQAYEANCESIAELQQILSKGQDESEKESLELRINAASKFTFVHLKDMIIGLIGNHEGFHKYYKEYVLNSSKYSPKLSSLILRETPISFPKSSAIKQKKSK